MGWVSSIPFCFVFFNLFNFATLAPKGDIDVLQERDI